MLIHHTNKVVSTLSRILPNAFVFVIDTTDRTFIFKSTDSGECQDIIIELDQEIGMDKLVKDRGHCLISYNSRDVGIKYLATNTIAGFCLKTPFNSSRSLSLAQEELVSQIN